MLKEIFLSLPQRYGNCRKLMPLNKGRYIVLINVRKKYPNTYYTHNNTYKYVCWYYFGVKVYFAIQYATYECNVHSTIHYLLRRALKVLKVYVYINNFPHVCMKTFFYINKNRYNVRVTLITTIQVKKKHNFRYFRTYTPTNSLLFIEIIRRDLWLEIYNILCNTCDLHQF